jgi:hypothetical protein
MARHRMESMSEVVDASMAEKMTSEVWQGFLDLTEQKVVIRREIRLRLELARIDGLKDKQATLKVEHSYKLCPLRGRKTKFSIAHDLNYENCDSNLDLPRWESVVVLPDSARTRVGTAINISGTRIEDEVELPPREHGESISVHTSRLEIIDLPGSYHFYAPEFSKGLEVSLVGDSLGFSPVLSIRPLGGGKPLLNNQNTWSSEDLIFPGQGIEIKFMRHLIPEQPDAKDAVSVDRQTANQGNSETAGVVCNRNQ